MSTHNIPRFTKHKKNAKFESIQVDYVRNNEHHNISTTLERPVIDYWGGGVIK